MLIAITPGDPEGIGPEVVIKLIRSLAQKYRDRILLIGAEVPLKKAPFAIRSTSETEIMGLIQKSIRPRPRGPYLLASPTHLTPGGHSGWSIQRAISLFKKGLVGGVVTGPISKKRLQEGGYPFNGHTDFLASLCDLKPDDVTMMLANSKLRVSLVTTHVPLSSVAPEITQTRVLQTILRTVAGLRSYWGVRRPKIAVCALNPHAGESGVLGKEELDKILPAIQSAKQTLGSTATVTGPFSSDALFAHALRSSKKTRPDSIVAMYHDQGLIPVKLLDFPNTVNITLGLPLVRTSVDHGVAFDIVGRGIADPSSLRAAFFLALQILPRQKIRKKK